MSKGNMTYHVVIYVGGFDSRETRTIYTTSKESQAQRFLHTYLRNHPEVSKAFIERRFSRESTRDAKRRREED